MVLPRVIETAAGVAGGVVGLGSFAVLGYTVAVLGWRNAPLHARLSAAWLAMFGIAIGLGEGLLLLRAFTPAALVVVGAVAFGAARTHRVPLQAAFLADMAQIRELTRAGLGTRWALAVLPFAVLVLVRTFRGVVLPQTSWDALTYHLYRAGTWVQHGRFWEIPAPDAWAYYEWFPPAADIPWAWAMLGHRTDTFVGLVAVAGWLGVAAASWGAARTGGASRPGAALATLAASGTAASLSVLSAAYVDNLVTGFVLSAALFSVRLALAPNSADGIAALVAVSLAATGKASLLPAAVVPFAVVVWALLRRGWRPSAGAVLAAGAAGLLLITPMIRTYLLTGNPLFPFPLRVGGRTLLAGDAALEAVLAGEGFVQSHSQWPGEKVVTALFGIGRELDECDFGGYGPVGLLVLAATAAGAVYAWRVPAPHDSARVAVGVQCTLGLLLAATFLQNLADPAMAAYLDAFAPTTGRLLLPAFAVLALPIAHLPRPALAVLLPIVSFASVFLAWPTGWDQMHSGMIAAATVGGGGCVAILAWAWRRSWAGAILFAWGLAVALSTFRANFPWAEAVKTVDGDAVYDFHHLDASAYGLAPIWDMLEDYPATRIAVMPAPASGQTVYLYPAMGRRLQHELIYVPICRNGAAIHLMFRPLGEECADEPSWRERLLKSGATLLLAGSPPPIEIAWIRPHRDLFALVAVAQGNKGALYLVDRANLAQAVAAGSPDSLPR